MTLLRHGETGMSPDYCFGQLNVPLSKAGRDHIRSLAADWPCAVPASIVCSDLIRARETAELIADALDMRCHVDQRLRELNFGEWEGRTWDDIHQQSPELMAQWGADWQNTSPPGGESLHQLFDRVRDCWATIEPNSLVVAHAGSLRALRCHVRSESSEHFFDWRFDHGVPVQLD